MEEKEFYTYSEEESVGLLEKSKASMLKENQSKKENAIKELEDVPWEKWLEDNVNMELEKPDGIRDLFINTDVPTKS